MSNANYKLVNLRNCIVNLFSNDMAAPANSHSARSYQKIQNFSVLLLPEDKDKKKLKIK